MAPFRQLEGILEAGKSNRYALPYPPVSKCTKRLVGKAAGVSLATDKILSINLKSGPREFLKVSKMADLNDYVWFLNALSYLQFNKRAFWMKFLLWKRNPTYSAVTAALQTATAEQKAQEWLVTENDRIYYSSSLGAGLFLETPVVSLDGCEIKNFLQEYQPVYHSLNELACAKRVLKSKLRTDIPVRGSTAKDIVAGAVGAAKTAYQQQNIIAHTATLEARPIYSSWTYSGLYPFDCQNYAMESLTRQTVAQPYLPPGCEVSIRIAKRDAPEAALEFGNNTSTIFFGDDEGQAVSLRLEIVDFGLTADSMVLDNDDLFEKWKNLTKSYWVDIPRVRLSSLPPGISIHCESIDLPSDTLLFLAAFCLERQLFYNKASKKTVVQRFRFPPEVELVKMQLHGKDDDLVVMDGIQGLGGEEGYISPSVHAYYTYLVESGLYDKDFKDFMPIQTNNISYDQFLGVDLTPHNKFLKESSELLLQLKMAAGGLPTKRYLISFTVQQKKLTYDPKLKWVLED